MAAASASGARNTIPPFLSVDGPVREVRFKLKPDGSRDGGVKALFTISGRVDAPGCNIAQPDFQIPRTWRFASRRRFLEQA